MMKDVQDTPFRSQQMTTFVEVAYDADCLEDMLPPPPPAEDNATYDQVTILSLRCERLEAALAKIKTKAKQFKEERDQTKRKLREVQSSRVMQQTCDCSISQSTCSSARKVHAEAKTVPGSVRQADRVQLKRTDATNAPIKPSELIRIGVESTKVAEYLTRDTRYDSTILETLNSGTLSPEELLKIEVQNLQIECDYTKAQLSVSEISLTESRSLSDYLSSICSQMESNSAAYQLAIAHAIKSNQAYQYIIALQTIHMEKGQQHQDGAPADVDEFEETSWDTILKISQFVHEIQGPKMKPKTKLQRKERSTGREPDEGFCSTEPANTVESSDGEQPSSSPEPGTSTLSPPCAASLISSLHCCSYTCMEQCRRMLGTVVAVEPSLPDEGICNLSCTTSTNAHTPQSIWQQRIELENAVMLQEVMAVKEDKADLEGQLYLMEQDKCAVELALKSKLNELQAIRLRLQHVDQERSTMEQSSKEGAQGDCMQNRIADLLDALEAVTESNDKQQLQNQTMIADLRYANSVLLNVLDKMRRRFEHKFGRLKEQMDLLKAKHRAQME